MDPQHALEQVREPRRVNSMHPCSRPNRAPAPRRAPQSLQEHDLPHARQLCSTTQPSYGAEKNTLSLVHGSFRARIYTRLMNDTDVVDGRLRARAFTPRSSLASAIPAALLFQQSGDAMRLLPGVCRVDAVSVVQRVVRGCDLGGYEGERESMLKSPVFRPVHTIIYSSSTVPAVNVEG